MPPNSAATPKSIADRLRVADVEVAVRLGREAGLDAAAVLAALAVLGHDGANEIERLPLGSGGLVVGIRRRHGLLSLL